MRALPVILALLPGAVGAQTATSVPASEFWVPGFRAAVGECWSIANLGPEAAAAQVTLAVRFDPSARPLADSIALIGSSGGNPQAVEQLYQSARRAILRCGTEGYGLPPEKFALWQRMEVQFVPGTGAER